LCTRIHVAQATAGLAAIKIGVFTSRKSKQRRLVTTTVLGSLNKMLRSPSRKTRRHAFDLNDHRHQQQPQQEAWPEDTIVVLPETPRVRLSPRRKMMPQTPGWPPATDMGETIRMYHDPEDQENETVDFTMNQEFVESISPLSLLPARLVSFRRAFV